MSPVKETIKQLLADNNIAYEVFTHEPVFTNPAMADALGVDETATVKSIVAVTKEDELIVIVLPGNQRIDWKLTARCAGTKKVTFAKPERVSQVVGCEVGCVPPFGQKTSLPVYMDPALTDSESVYFNPGVHDVSFKIRSVDLKQLCRPVMLQEDAR